MRIKIAKECKELGIFVAHTEVLGVTNGRGKFHELMNETEEKFRKGDTESLKIEPVVRAYRDFYWKIGIDPTKTRPSGEALRRRVVRGDSLPRINDVVDAGNLVSLETLISIGLYDLEKFKGEPWIVLSRGGELFQGLGNKIEELQRGVPIMVDELGTVMHIFPHRDSVLTSVRIDTRNVLVVGAGVPGIEPPLVMKAVKMTASLLEGLGGRVSHEVTLE
ncbi:hypothetical protein MetMK1DRAFT_00031370 [Metallosphaera yellowstonensis MK1]|uniref:B3/B4 tRNA-binding domain-containing protein n=1 Tax=Metallosphaera yellowstonensis MK1 TaxID=671065 RepID=H2C966_9CREN|nr:phenylalanine--tRNA ligase beta subunit-related protein [Metallosphaera yellowstonensis]EHP68692.1 hypothetical protein MetMK1DRAFT_00031370 [Metallosphaera yellowstonensis MK1]